MTHTYNVSGMTCGDCQATVQRTLSKIKGISNVVVDLAKGTATIDMEKHVPTIELQRALKDHPKFQLTENGIQRPINDSTENGKSWMETYRPIPLVFGYILGISLLIEVINGGFVWMRWMQYFMAGFFLVFSFFKFLNLKGFAESYAMYDIIAKRWSGWGYVYAFAELGLGIAFLTGFNPILTNLITFLIMGVSIIGVLQSVLNKRKIKCACLGAVFELPISTITIIEDALMIFMSGIMVVTLL